MRLLSLSNQQARTAMRSMVAWEDEGPPVGHIRLWRSHLNGTREDLREGPPGALDAAKEVAGAVMTALEAGDGGEALAKSVLPVIRGVFLLPKNLRRSCHMFEDSVPDALRAAWGCDDEAAYEAIWPSVSRKVFPRMQLADLILYCAVSGERWEIAFDSLAFLLPTNRITPVWLMTLGLALYRINMAIGLLPGREDVHNWNSGVCHALNDLGAAFNFIATPWAPSTTTRPMRKWYVLDLLRTYHTHVVENRLRMYLFAADTKWNKIWARSRIQAFNAAAAAESSEHAHEHQRTPKRHK